MRDALACVGVGFRPEAHVDMGHDNAFGTGPTTRISARTFLRLRYVRQLAAISHMHQPASLAST